MAKDFRKALGEEILLADGAMGTLLVSRGASPEQAKSPLNVTDPESVREVHDDYRDAGARILTTNTWDANRVKLTAHEWADSLEKINREGARLARESAAGEMVFVAGSMGPLGALVKPYGRLTLVQVREIFEEQARALLEGGVDLILLETFGSLLEAAEAVRAVRGLSADDADRRADDVSVRRPDRVRRERLARAVDARAGGRRRRRDELHARPAGDARRLLEADSLRAGAALRVMPNAGYPTVVHGRNVYLSSPDYLRDYALGLRRGGRGDHRRLLRHDARAHPRDGQGRRRTRARGDGANRHGLPGDSPRAARRAGDRDLAPEAKARRRERVRRHRRGRASEGRRPLRGARRRAAS